MGRDTHNPAKTMRDFRIYFSCKTNCGKVNLKAFLDNGASLDQDSNILRTATYVVGTFKVGRNLYPYIMINPTQD
jgi:hypothetical protein